MIGARALDDFSTNSGTEDIVHTFVFRVKLNPSGGQGY
jgi:hypothetical protein